MDFDENKARYGRQLDFQDDQNVEQCYWDGPQASLIVSSQEETPCSSDSDSNAENYYLNDYREESANSGGSNSDYS